MNILRYILLSSILTVGSISAFAQTGVSINSTGTAADANAILDVSSTDKGVLLPRVADHTTVATDANGDYGLVVFDTTTKSYWFWDGTSWQEIPSVANTGNTLDEAYDEGGPGAGRVINATNGNVEITGSGFLTVASNVGIGTTAPDRRMKISGTGWTALEVENTDNQDAALELTSQGVSSYVFTDNTGFLGIESGTGQQISLRTDGANERVVVQSDGRLRVNNLADPNSAVVLSNPAGVLGKSSLTGNATDVFLGTGVFGPASAFADDDWYQTLSTNTPTSINDWIYTNGHVGIGVGASSDPSAPLHVAASGAGNPAGNSILASNPANSAGQDAIITARVAGSSAGDPFFSMDISGEAGWSMGVDNDHANRFKIATSWSNLSAGTAVTIQTDGNVGLGTTAPSEKLTVAGTNADIYPALGLRSGNDNNGFNNGAQIAFGYNGTDDYQHFIQTRHNSSNSQNAIDFYVSNGTQHNTLTSGSTHTMSLVSGNVGIGTTGPAQKLEVAGNARITGLAGGGDRIVYTNNNGDLYPSTGIPAGDNDYIQNQNASDQGANFRISGSGSANVYYVNHGSGNVLEVGDDAWIGDINGGNFIGVYGQQNSNHGGVRLGSNSSATLYSDGSANIGVGTTTPAEKLHVNGSIRVEDGQLNTGVDNLRLMEGVRSDDNSYEWVGFYSGTTRQGIILYDGQWGGANNLTNEFSITAENSNLLTLNTNGNHIAMMPDGSGNVGVGTTAPSGKLHVAAGEGDGIVLGSPNDPMGYNGGSTSIKFYGYRDVVSNAIGAKISAERTDRCCGYLSQGTELAFHTNDGLTTSNADNSVERVRITDSGTLQAKYGIQTEKNYYYFQRYKYCNCYGAGSGLWDIGNYDFCAVAQVGFKNNQSNADEDDDVQCAVYPTNHGGYGEQTNYNISFSYNYANRPHWRMYAEAYEDSNGVTCAASCINLD
ncbi:MAG: Cyanophage [Bacteroidota bacterium]|jgi:hypothetical protein